MAEEKKTPGRALRIAGEVSGVTPAWRIARDGFAKPLRGSIGRTQGLIGSLSDKRSAELPDVDPSIVDSRERFEAAMELHGKTDADVARIVATTHKQGVLYLVLAMVAVAVGILSFRFAPLTGSLSGFGAVARFAVAPLVGALAFRACYTNWMMRHRRLAGPLAYVRSRDWLSKPNA